MIERSKHGSSVHPRQDRWWSRDLSMVRVYIQDKIGDDREIWAWFECISKTRSVMIERSGHGSNVFPRQYWWWSWNEIWAWFECISKTRSVMIERSEHGSSVYPRQDRWWSRDLSMVRVYIQDKIGDDREIWAWFECISKTRSAMIERSEHGSSVYQDWWWSRDMSNAHGSQAKVSTISSLYILKKQMKIN